MELYNVKLTEREVKETGGLRWQRASWKRLSLYALASITLLFAVLALTLNLTEAVGIMRKIGVLASMIPVIVFAFWFLVRLKNEGRKFLEQVERGGV